MTRAGRVWSGATRELRQAPAVGEERVLAERNRRERADRSQRGRSPGRARLASRPAARDSRVDELESGAEAATSAHRAAVRARDEAAEEHRRLAAMIEHRRAAPDDGPDAGGGPR